MHTGVIQYITRTFRLKQEVILTIDEAMDIICEVIKDTEIITIVIEGMVTEVRVMIEIEVGHYIDRIEVGEMIEVQVMVGLVRVKNKYKQRQD